MAPCQWQARWCHGASRTEPANPGEYDIFESKFVVFAGVCGLTGTGCKLAGTESLDGLAALRRLGQVLRLLRLPGQRVVGR